MICQNCGAHVDDDLIFCTNCGVRQVVPTAPTVSMNDSVVTKVDNAKPPKSSSPWKWLALIIALIAIPVSILGVYLIMFRPNYSQISQTQPNVNKSNSPVPTPTRKAETNQNLNANVSNANDSNENTNSQESNSNENSSGSKKKTEVMNERIEIEPKSSYAKSFTIEGDTKTFLGDVELLQGETYKGFVYLQSQYDEHFPDELYKMFIFGEEKKSEVKSRLIPQDYVLIFVNETDKPIVIQGNFWLE